MNAGLRLPVAGSPGTFCFLNWRFRGGGGPQTSLKQNSKGGAEESDFQNKLPFKAAVGEPAPRMASPRSPEVIQIGGSSSGQPSTLGPPPPGRCPLAPTVAHLGEPPHTPGCLGWGETGGGRLWFVQGTPNLAASSRPPCHTTYVRASRALGRGRWPRSSREEVNLEWTAGARKDGAGELGWGTPQGRP